MDIEKFLTESKKARQAIAQTFGKLMRNTPKDLDDVTHALHEAAFEEINCLDCANCCKTTSPIFYQKDIERASKYLHLKPGDFIQKYLRLDEDNDYVLQSAPCTFLGADNYCAIYDARPSACKEYPHTNRKKVYQVFEISIKNALICPAVFKVFEGLNQKYINQKNK